MQPVKQAALPFHAPKDHGPPVTDHGPRTTGDEPPATHDGPRTKYPGPIFVRHARARRYVVSVREDGGVRVTLPRWGSMREARAFAAQQEQWIERQRQRIEEQRA